MSITSTGQADFLSKVANFSDAIYRMEPDSRIWKVMWTLLEDAGVGQLAKMQTVARLSESLGSACYSDLDHLFGRQCGLPRLAAEQYAFDPYRDQLTAAQWDEVEAKDALYRGRLSMFLRSMARGGTPEGIAMIAEAAAGCRFEVVEMWRYPDSVGPIGRLNVPREFVLLPSQTLTTSEERAVYRAVARLKPVNTLATVGAEALEVFLSGGEARHAAADQSFEIRRFVAVPKPPRPPLPPSGMWLVPGLEIEAPMFAHLRTGDGLWYLNESATLSSWRVRPALDLRVASLAATALDTDLTMLVSEERPLPQGGFRIKVDAEVIAVASKTPQPSGEQLYDIVRGQDGTTPAAHLSSQAAYSDYESVGALPGGGGIRWGPSVPIERADSPDNYPLGKYAGDQTKYDSSGGYLFSWASQQDYLDDVGRRLRERIQALDPGMTGAEVDAILARAFSDGAYREPVSPEPTPSDASKPEHALAPPHVRVRSTFYPGALGLGGDIEGAGALQPGLAASLAVAGPRGGGRKPGTPAPPVGDEEDDD